MPGYVPIDKDIFMAAYLGASAGMGMSGRWVTDQASVSPNNTAITAVAGAYAISVDAEFAAEALPNNCITLEAIKLYTMAVFQERNPNQVPPTSANVLPANFTPVVKSILSTIAADLAYFAAQGISIPSCCCNPPGG
jgi:hypothetical protein